MSNGLDALRARGQRAAGDLKAILADPAAVLPATFDAEIAAMSAVVAATVAPMLADLLEAVEVASPAGSATPLRTAMRRIVERNDQFRKALACNDFDEIERLAGGDIGESDAGPPGEAGST